MRWIPQKWQGAMVECPVGFRPRRRSSREAFQISSAPIGVTKTYPAVAASDTGSFVVVWQSNQDTDGTNGIFGRRYSSSGSALAPEFQVHSYTTSYQSAPSVASDSTGNFVVV